MQVRFGIVCKRDQYCIKLTILDALRFIYLFFVRWPIGLRLFLRAYIGSSRGCQSQFPEGEGRHAFSA